MALCLVSGLDGVRKLMRPSPDPRSWLSEHIGGMIGTGIAAHTAFLAFGAVRLCPGLYVLPAGLSVVPWVAPTVVGVIAIVLVTRRYRGRSEPVRSA